MTFDNYVAAHTNSEGRVPRAIAREIRERREAAANRAAIERMEQDAQIRLANERQADIDRARKLARASTLPKPKVGPRIAR